MMHFFSEVLVRERQEQARSEAAQANARRMAAARPQHTNRPDRLKLFFRR